MRDKHEVLDGATRYRRWRGRGEQNSDTHGHGFDGFDELLALQVLQDLVDLRQGEVALKTNVSAPDTCSMTATQQHNPEKSLQV